VTPRAQTECVSAHCSPKDRANDELKALMMLVLNWADEKGDKKEDRVAGAGRTVVCGGRSKGSLLWAHSAGGDMIAEETGSQPVQVAAPDLVDGEMNSITMGASSWWNMPPGKAARARCEGHSCYRSERTATSFVTAAA
jgi:hypothetical protein